MNYYLYLCLHGLCMPEIIHLVAFYGSLCQEIVCVYVFKLMLMLDLMHIFDSLEYDLANFHVGPIHELVFLKL